jgi:hypothetical protein
MDGHQQYFNTVTKQETGLETSRTLRSLRSHQPRACWLNLPKDLHIHPVQPISHLSNISKEPLPGKVEPVSTPVIVNTEEEYEVAQIEDFWLFWRQLQYLVKWKGNNDMSFEPAVNMDALKAIDKFHTQQSGKPGT